MKSSGIGGQAVIEGIMIKNKNHYAVAVRTPEKEIVVEESQCRDLTKSGVASFPVIRGIVTFIESMRIGMRILSYSASFFDEEEQKKTEKEEKKEAIVMGVMTFISIIAAMLIFIGLPFMVSNLIKSKVPSEALRGLIEGAIRVGLFICYVKAISMMKDIKRVFMYHGAEHKAINCIENGLELSVENIKKQTRVHKRCGTSFLLVVMLISILFFLFIVVDSLWLRMLIRLLLVPVIAGVSYEFIRFAGRSESKVIDVLSKPGLWLQGMTTREPDDDMIEVAIVAVEAVFDWKVFITEETDNENKKRNIQLVKKIDDAKKETDTSHEKDNEGNEGIEMIDINAEDEDEILNALDRYFEFPKEEQKK